MTTFKKDFQDVYTNNQNNLSSLNLTQSRAHKLSPHSRHYLSLESKEQIADFNQSIYAFKRVIHKSSALSSYLTCEAPSLASTDSCILGVRIPLTYQEFLKKGTFYDVAGTFIKELRGVI